MYRRWGLVIMPFISLHSSLCRIQVSMKSGEGQLLARRSSYVFFRFIQNSAAAWKRAVKTITPTHSLTFYTY